MRMRDRSNTYQCEPCGSCPWCQRDRKARADAKRFRALLKRAAAVIRDASAGIEHNAKELEGEHTAGNDQDATELRKVARRYRRTESAIASALTR